MEMLSPRKEKAALAKLASSRTASARAILKTMGYGAFLRGVESVLEQELRYVDDDHTSAGDGKEQRKRKRAPRVALSSAAAVIGLLAIIEDPWAAGVAAALHLGFHGSGKLWKWLSFTSVK